VLRCSQDHLRTGMNDLDHHVFCRCRKYRQLVCHKGDLQCAFSLDVSMVHSSVLAVSADGECLMCGGFSLGKTIRFGSLQFIADCFCVLSFFPRRNDSGAAFIASTRRATVPTVGHDRGLHRGVLRGSDLPSSRRHDTGAPSTPVATTPWLDDALATQAT
jgi:hypothetical protein